VSVGGLEECVFEVENQPSGLGWLPDGSLLVVSMKDQRVLRRDPSGEVTVHADLSGFTDSSLNDMRRKRGPGGSEGLEEARV
jgi:sugar lactone lactonase YvrE